MAAVAPPADQARYLLQKLSLNSKAKTFEVPIATKQYSIVSSNANNGIQSDRTVTPLSSDPTMCYLPNGYPSTGFYYGGYGGSANEWGEYTKYMNSEGFELYSGVYGDNRSLMYHHGYGYAPYGPYSQTVSNVPTVGHDGQLYGAQHYQYPTPYFQSIALCGPYSAIPAPVKGEMATAADTDQVSLSMDSKFFKSNGVSNNQSAKVNNGLVPSRATKNSSFKVNGSYGSDTLSGGISGSGYLKPRFGFDGLQSQIPCLESPYFSDGHSGPIISSSMTLPFENGNGLPSTRSQSIRPHLMPQDLNHPRPTSGTNTSNGYVNKLYPNKLYGQYGNAYRSGLGYGFNDCYSRTNGYDWMAADCKYKPRVRANGFYAYGNENTGGLNELNRGPRAKSSKNQKGFSPVALAVKGQTTPTTGMTENDQEKLRKSLNREQYNLPNFPETYSDAKFFIIKSYSEDDVHKSIKYNVWASTPNGNKKLDGAYLDAQSKPGGCPVFLLFSVNTSGQFVGVAEMAGRVDFNKNVEYWQQDKWIGCFPVKWHIVKDLPNSLLKHIILENNESKPVTYSRDTQEVKLEQGLQMLKIFRDHNSKQCILDDFYFYEDCQKRIEEKKAKQQQFQKLAKVWEGKLNEEKAKEKTNLVLENSKSSEAASELNKQSDSSVIQTNGDRETSEKSDLSESGDIRSVNCTKIPDKKLVAKGVVNGC